MNQMLPLPLPHFHSGKVRDTYEIPGHPRLLLIVASDRLSTHNVVHQSLVLGKGELLTALSIFWIIDILADVNHHIVAWGKRIYDYLPIGEYPDDLCYRAVVVRRRRVTKVEFIYRDYLCGSLRKLYKLGRDPYRLHLRPDLPLMYRFPTTLFTPTEKSDTDDPIPYRDVQDSAPAGVMVTREVFFRGRAHLASRGVTLIDFKAEASGNMLVDEWLNGDCCRMAWIHDVREGEEPSFLDKEVFRQEAVRQWGDGPKTPLVFAETTLKQGIRRYHDGFEAITDRTLSRFQKEFLG